MPEQAHTATTGVAELDRALNGLYWGDNVVLDAEDPDDVEPFYRAAAAGASSYQSAAFVTLTTSPETLKAAYPGLDVVDARASGALTQPRPLLDAIRTRSTSRQLLLFDSLEAMADRWGPELATRFFARCCPMLLGLGAIAYWSLTAASHSRKVRSEIEGITQCVLVVGGGRLRVAKAEGRPPGVEGSVYHYEVSEGLPVLKAAPAAARLGAALRSLRDTRRLSQGELAKLAGISASAISQAERGRRGLSLGTLLELTGKLNITLDELFRGDEAPGYRIVRRDDPRHAALDHPAPLFDDPRAGLRVYLLRLSPGGSATPDFAHKGVEVVTVARGVVQVELGTGRPVLREGEALVADRSGVSAWRNLTDREALLFWILRDEA